MLRSLLFALTLLVAGNVSALADPPAAVMYINPQCSCCLGHANYLRQNGFKITVKETQDMSQIRRQHGVPEKFEGCHIMLIDFMIRTSLNDLACLEAAALDARAKETRLKA